MRVALYPEDLAAIAELERLVELRIDLSANVEGSNTVDLAPIAAMPSLQRLAISSDLITDLRPFAAFERLTALSVAGCESLADLTPITRLKALQHLDVFRTGVADLTPIAAMDLVSLDVGYTSSSSIAPLAGLTHLRALEVAGTDVSDLSPLSSLSSLESLDISSSLVTDAHVVASLPALRRLLAGYVGGVPVAAFAKRGKLEVLDVTLTGVPDTARSAFRSAHPNVRLTPYWVP